MNKHLIVKSSFRYPEIEKLIHSTDRELKEKAVKNAKHFAKSNLPSQETQSLAPLTGELRTGYESLQSFVLQKLQPATHFPEASMDADHLKEKDKQLEAETKRNEDQIKNDEYELGHFRHSSIKGRLNIAIFLTIILSLGETVFNAFSFSVFGENLIFSLLLSLAVSLGVCAIAHFSAFLFKGAKNRSQQWIIGITTILIVSGIFVTLSVFRSKYLEYHEVSISPVYFFIFNFFFFTVATLISLIMLPTWQEIKDNLHRLKLAKGIDRRKKEIQILKEQKDSIKRTVLENTKLRVRDSYYAIYVIDHINKLHRECIEQFKSANLTNRTDGIVPQCFNMAVYDISKPNLDFTLDNPSKK